MVQPTGELSDNKPRSTSWVSARDFEPYISPIPNSSFRPSSSYYMVMGSPDPDQLFQEPVMLSEIPRLALPLPEPSAEGYVKAEAPLCCLGKVLPGDLPPTTQKGIGNTFLGHQAGLSEHFFASRTPNSKLSLWSSGYCKEKDHL